MARTPSERTDAHWTKIAPLLPQPTGSPRGGPRPSPNRPVCEGSLWSLRTGARGQDLPARFPAPSTCWRRLRGWEEHGVWLKAWRAFFAQLEAPGPLDWAEAFADSRCAPAKTGARRSARRSGGKARRGWWWSTAKVFLWETSWHRRPQP